MEIENNKPMIKDHGYALGVRLPSGGIGYFDVPRLFSGQNRAIPAENFGEISPLVNVSRLSTMFHVKRALGEEIFERFVTQESDAASRSGILNRFRRTDTFEFNMRDVQNLVVAHVETAFQPANPENVKIALDEQRVARQAQKWGYPGIGGNEVSQFYESLDEAPPEGFEKAGYLIVDKRTIEEKTKIPGTSAEVSGWDIKFYDRNLLLQWARERETPHAAISLSNDRPNGRDVFSSLSSLPGYGEILSHPEKYHPQIVRAGIRATPLLPAQAGLIYEYTKQMAEKKLGVVEAFLEIGRVNRVARRYQEASVRKDAPNQMLRVA
jgi:hypothetical protein